MKKKSIEYIFNKIIGVNNEKVCDEINCKNPGKYEAPKSPNSDEKHTFCLTHVKEYNKRWNFFAGKTQNQIYDYQKNDFFIGRPTRPFSKGVNSKIKFEFEYTFDNENLNFQKKKHKQKIPKVKKYSAEIIKCLEIFNFNDEFSEKELKKRYKELVKKYHPDLNKDYLNKDKNIKEINKSYSKLIKFLKK
ncbi:MAG: hypothetical protein CL572_04245 [Alphaproteobacteria bacterium]|nr:hypothetical protein [Alphaproteobacteria bacterium]